jgi:hypothetical protein
MDGVRSTPATHSKLRAEILLHEACGAPDRETEILPEHGVNFIQVGVTKEPCSVTAGAVSDLVPRNCADTKGDKELKRAILIFMKRILIAGWFVCSLVGQDWGPAQFLVGRWVGEGGGQPGQGTGAFSFTPDLQGKILVRNSFADYPAANGRPAFRHDDLTIVYRDETTHGLRATYFDSEEHVIPYSVKAVEGGVVFLSEGPPSSLRFRMTYLSTGKDTLKIKFEIAAPGKEFAPYIEAAAHRDIAGK